MRLVTIDNLSTEVFKAFGLGKMTFRFVVDYGFSDVSGFISNAFEMITKVLQNPLSSAFSRKVSGNDEDV